MTGTVSMIFKMLLLYPCRFHGFRILFLFLFFMCVFLFLLLFLFFICVLLFLLLFLFCFVLFLPCKGLPRGRGSTHHCRPVLYQLGSWCLCPPTLHGSFPDSSSGLVHWQHHIQYSRTHRHMRKTIPLPLSSAEERLEEFKKNFSLETAEKYTQKHK